MDPSRMFIVPLGVFTSRFEPRLSSEQARAMLGLPKGPLAITLAAHIRSFKGGDYLIEELGHPDVADWSLVWLGHRTDETPELEAMAARIAPGRVFLRTVEPERVTDYLAASDLALFASQHEAFGIAVIEAMAAGLAVLVRDIPSFRYIIGDDEQISPLREPGALLPHLAAARSPELRRARGERNRTRAREIFDWASLVPQYLEMYERVLASS
ncbi:MAG: glycosyltransferase family 4 protein [Acidobacteria bacterium]|nr:glycosyltransferase family 4 protein [Acidobacteriota bacterium]